MVQINSSWFSVAPWVIIVVVIAIFAFIAITVVWGIQAHRHRAFVGEEELVGKTAEVKTALEPRGVVLVEGENWAAISEKGRIEPGEEVVITRVERLKLWVTKKE